MRLWKVLSTSRRVSSSEGITVSAVLPVAHELLHVWPGIRRNRSPRQKHVGQSVCIFLGNSHLSLNKRSSTVSADTSVNVFRQSPVGVAATAKSTNLHSDDDTMSANFTVVEKYLQSETQQLPRPQATWTGVWFKTAIADDRVLPEGMGYEEYSETFVALGHWDDDGEFAFYHGKGEIPDGTHVEMRRVRDADGYGGKFNTLLSNDNDQEDKEGGHEDDDDAQDEGDSDDGEEEEGQFRNTNCDPVDSPCLFLCEHCYHYMRAWLDVDSLPDRRRAFPSGPEVLSFAGELYEIINSRKQQRGAIRVPVHERGH